MSRPHLPARARSGALLTCALTATAAAVAAAPAEAVNTVTTANGAAWQIHDAAAPALDTGSIRTITGNAFYGFGSIKVHVSDIPASDPTRLFDGTVAVRGFGLDFDRTDTFTTKTPVTLGGLRMKRAIKVYKTANWTRWLDTFTNTSGRTITADVSFGGTLGTNTTAGNQTSVVDSSSGDTSIGSDDSWVEIAVGTTGTPAVRSKGPSAVVLGAPSPFSGALTGTGNHQRSPFGEALPSTGLDANFYGFKNRLVLAPGQTKSLLRYVVGGIAETSATAGTQVPAVRAAAVALAAAPDTTGLSAADLCTISNYNAPTLPGYDATACRALPVAAVEPDAQAPVTTSPYDVVDKSITQLQADMEAGVTTSQQITRAYLDRIAAYDQGPFGFHAYITVAKDAMAQAKAADDARAAGTRGDLLGIPVNIKDLYDTKDMPTTDGSLSLEGWQPKTDAFQVARLRAAGAVILGKGNLSEFANSGSYSDSGYMMTANAFKPSKTSLGSSGGPAVATALSMAGFAMGTQTGVSLYAPSTGASLVSLRGTDGISSGSGVMPLTYLQDFEGPIARTTSDVARILNVTNGTDPGDPATVAADADAKRPADYKAFLDKDALKGKKIGYIVSSFDGTPQFGQNDGTITALKARFADIEAAGATMVPITAAIPAGPANVSTTPRSRTEEGWQHYWQPHLADNPPFTTAGGSTGILDSPKNLPYNRTVPTPPAGTPAPPRLTATDVANIIASRDAAKARFGAFMDAQGVDAIVYPGFRSDVYDNDGAQTISSDRSTNVPTSNFGLPTLILPVGANPDGDPMSLQFVGRAFDDPKMLGFGYALEQQLQGKGHLLSPQAPKLAYDPGATPVTVTSPPVPAAPVTAAALEAPTEKKGVFVRLPRVSAVKGSTAAVKLTNAGASKLAGTVKLTVRRKGRTVSYGVRYLSLAPKASGTVSIPLTAAGRAALRAKRTLVVTATYRLGSDGLTSVQKTVIVLRR